MSDDFKLQSRNVQTEWVTYKGRKALRVTDVAPASVGGIDRLIILSKTEFQDAVQQHSCGRVLGNTVHLLYNA